MAKRKGSGFRRPPPAPTPAPATPPTPDPAVSDRAQRNYVRGVLAGAFAQAAHTYTTVSGTLESALQANVNLPDEAYAFLAEAVKQFSAFHDSIGAALGELAPSHHDRELWIEVED